MTIKPLVEPDRAAEHLQRHCSQGFPFSLRTLAASVALACCALTGQSAYALALGRITVQSALGEPLRAEIDIPDINSDEASSLRATVAQPEVFKRAGLDFNPMLSNTQISMQRRANGRVYLLLTSDRVVNDPFLDLILEANWSAGRIVRDYTMLFDPPATRQQLTAAATVAPLAPVVSPVATETEARPVSAPAPVPQAPPAAVRAPASPRAPVQAAPVAAAPKPVTTPPAAVSQSNSAPANGQRVTVRPGDTATKIALVAKPTKVSLDQMLIAMLRSNPDAFIAGNVNRLKAGAILDMPSQSQFDSIADTQASQEVLAQSRDFDDFRRKLADGAPIVATETSKRATSGKVQTQVEDKKPGNTATDKLSLQKATVSSQADTKAQDKAASDLAAKDAASRLAELNKNIADLNKLAAASSTVAAPVPPPAVKASEPATAPTVTIPVTAAPVPEPLASQPVAVASEPAASPAPAVAASVPSAPVATVPAPVEEPGFMTELLDNPMVPAGAGGLVALLAGLALYRSRQRKKSGQVDSSFMESRLQPDSFFGASGGQKIDTTEGETGNSSLAYSPSQLDAAGDVDPVAEADVYLAYGRDLQAEEILKEAVRTNPSRAAIHFKLLQIYAKRRDIKAYIAVATDAHKLSRGLGPEWAHAAEVGRELDPTHPLFMADGDADLAAIHAATQAMAAEQGAVDSGSGFLATDVGAESPAPVAASTFGPLDLDLDFSEELGANTADSHASQVSRDQNLMPPTIDFDPASPIAAAQADNASIDFDSSSMGLGNFPELSPAADDAANAVASFNDNLDKTQPVPSSGPPPLEFDLGGLSLDLDAPMPLENVAQADGAPVPASPPSPAGPVSAPAVLDSVFNDSGPDSRGGEVSADEALATKLALAEEFQAIGDDDGARTLAQEVVDAATGNLKAKAQRFLAELG